MIKSYYQLLLHIIIQGNQFETFKIFSLILSGDIFE